MKVTIAEKPVPNIFKKGNLVIGKESKRILLVTGDSNNPLCDFEGVDLTNDKAEYSTGWSKMQFDLYTGTVTLENE